MKLIPVVAVLLLLVTPTALAKVPRPLRVCADINDFAPFTATGKLGTIGYNADYLKAMLDPIGQQASITRLPWIRCLALAAAGQFDLVLDATKVASRMSDFAYPRPHYWLSPIIMYRKGFKLPPIKTPADLAPLKQCQVLGWDYSLAGIKEINDGVTRPSTQGAAMAMLRAGRCEIMIYDLELIPDRQLNPGSGAGLDYIPLPWMATAEMHIMVSRAVPYADELLAMINAGVERMEKSGETARLQARHVRR